MFTTLLLFIYCTSLIQCSPIELKSNDKYVNGTQFTIKNTDTTYLQHVSNFGRFDATHSRKSLSRFVRTLRIQSMFPSFCSGQCTVELNEQANSDTEMLTEGEIVKVKDKWYKVEDCQLNRAYMMPCGSKLFRQMRELVCSLITQHEKKKIVKRQLTEEELINTIDRSYYGVCCRSACTIAELVQHCTTN